MGDWQNFHQMGGPPSPPRKKTLDSQTGCQIDDFENNMPCGLLKITGKCIIWECKAKFTCEEIHPNSFDRLCRAHVAEYRCGYSKWEHLEGMDSISGPNNYQSKICDTFNCTSCNLVYAIINTSSAVCLVSKMADRFTKHMYTCSIQLRISVLPIATHFSNNFSSRWHQSHQN